jgi:hypothetical protein
MAGNDYSNCSAGSWPKALKELAGSVAANTTLELVVGDLSLITLGHRRWRHDTGVPSRISVIPPGGDFAPADKDVHSEMSRSSALPVVKRS